MGRRAASQSTDGDASVGACAASPPAADDTEAEAEIQPPSQEACRRFSGFIGNGRCVRLALALGQSDLVGGVNRPQQFDGAKGTGLLHMVGQERHRPPNAAVAFLALHRGLLSSAQTSQSPRMTGVDCSRWTASDTPRDPPPRPMPPDTTGLAREHDVTLDDVPSRRPRYSLQGLPGQVVSAIVDTWSRFTPRGRRPLAQKAWGPAGQAADPGADRPPRPRESW